MAANTERVVVVHRQHQHADLRLPGHDAAGGLDTVEPGHVQVDHDHVRGVRPGRGDRTQTVRLLGDDLPSVWRVEKGREPAPVERVVVGHDDPQRSRSSRLQWQQRDHARSGGSVHVDPALAADLGGTLPHRGDTHAGSGAVGDADAVVADL